MESGKPRVFGYVRVSARDQNIDRQMIVMEKLKIPKTICLLTSFQERILTGPAINGW